MDSINSPVIIELLDHLDTNILYEGIISILLGMEIIPSTSSDAINLLFQSIDERKLQFVNDELNNNKVQTDIVTDFYREKVTIVSEEDKNEGCEILANKNYENNSNAIDDKSLNKNISSPIEESH
ncbi:unnamed protein product [Arctia plantaginis]|uniref:Uncharacterized protein n=1 Tax=Arctia plantaginis TaxID=874455 RepID=A0A8S1A644_ARCPL|nr:unnamed protein product [Arctia plantaginis]